jgi:hypothetical protein
MFVLSVVLSVQGGEFDAHEDGYSITLNLLLSDPTTAFEGGGTSFWAQPHTTSNGCQIRLRPERGTAVIFNGKITHAGMAVTEGTRHLYVASFDLDAQEGEMHVQSNAVPQGRE